MGSEADARFDAIVLAGGSARRLGGRDKAALVVGGQTLLERALNAVAAADRIVVVGPQKETSRPVIWTREDPPGGGPAAALTAGLEQVRAELLVLLAVDHPFVVPSTVRRLLDATGSHDGAMLSSGGRTQPLVAAYRGSSLRAAVARAASTVDMAVHDLVGDLDVVVIDDPRAAGSDIDTWDDAAEAERHLEDRG